MTYASYYMVVSWLLKMGGLKIISINEMTNGFWPPAFSDKKTYTCIITSMYRMDSGDPLITVGLPLAGYFKITQNKEGHIHARTAGPGLDCTSTCPSCKA